MLDNVKYIFQIPMTWFRRVNRLLFMWGGDGINVDMNAEDGPKISINPKRVSDMIAEAGGGGGGPELSNTTPAASTSNPSLATAGVATTAARGDHTHALSPNALSASKWVSTNSSGDLYTPNITPYSGDVTVVTNVSWTGTNLQMAKTKLTFERGLLTTVGTATTTTIDTPTVITWS